MKKIKLFLGFVVILASSFGITSCIKNYSADPSKNFVEVEGFAEKDYSPDEFYLSIRMNEADFLGKQQVEKLESDMKKTLTELGVDVKKSLVVSDMSSTSNDWWWYWRRNRGKIYTSKEYELKLQDLATIEKVVPALEGLKISNISLKKVDFSGLEKLKNEVRADAVKNAKEKAKALVGAVGQDVGKVVYIKENTVSAPNRYYEAYDASVAMEKSEEMPETQLDFKQSNIQYTVLVRFEIK